MRKRNHMSAQMFYINALATPSWSWWFQVHCLTLVQSLTHPVWITPPPLVLPSQDVSMGSIKQTLVTTLPHTKHKISSKWIKDLGISPQTTETMKEDVDKNCDTVLSDVVEDLTAVARGTKAKINEITSSKKVSAQQKKLPLRF